METDETPNKIPNSWNKIRPPTAGTYRVAYRLEGFSQGFHCFCEAWWDGGDWSCNNEPEASMEERPQVIAWIAEPEPCNKCGQPGSEITFENQICMPINRRVECIDHCIHHIVAALNAGGIETVASCCGHGTQPGRIDLADGRVLRIDEDEATADDGEAFSTKPQNWGVPIPHKETNTVLTKQVVAMTKALQEIAEVAQNALD